MTVTATHSTLATGTNDDTKQISKNAWNEDHTITGLGTAAEADTGDFEAAGAVATHSADTTNVHGITDTSALLTTSAAAAAYQPLDADLTAIAALSPANDDVIQRKSGAWTNRTMAQARTDLLTGANGGAAAAGGSVTIAGGTGDAGNDIGASIVVGGGSGAGSSGDITVVGVVSGSGTGDANPATLTLQGGGAGGNVTLAGGDGIGGEGGGDVTLRAGAGNGAYDRAQFIAYGNGSDGVGGNFEAAAGTGGTGLAGGTLTIAGGNGDAGTDVSAYITLGGGSGSGTPGVATVKSAGVTFTLKQAAYCNPATTTAGDIATALINAGLMAAS